MSRFPTLPPNSCHDGPHPPQGRFADTVANIHRMAGHREPLAIALVCAAEVSARITLRDTGPDGLAMIAWLTHHGAQWAALAQREAQVARRAA